MRYTKKEQGVDVEFAYMPYSNLHHPALGASILKKCLEKEGLKCKISYHTLDFAEIIGTVEYNRLLYSSTALLIGEWTFSKSAFGEEFQEQKARQLGCIHPSYSKELEEVSETAVEWINRLGEKIKIKPPKVLICSSMFQQNVASLALLKAVKQCCPEVYTVMGGPNTEGVLGLGLLRRAPWLDYICAGEGEETLPQLCKALIANNHLTEKPIGVLGQEDIEKYQGKLQINLPRATLAEMSKSPPPCFDDYFEAIKNSKIAIKPGLLLETSRGCWWGERSQCTFCGLNGEGMKYRFQNPIEMAKRVYDITKKHQIKNIEFVDNIIAKKYFEDFIPQLNEQILYLFYETKADFSESDAVRFKESGVRFIQPGIESLSDSVLSLMKKGTTAAVNIECLRLCREYGIRPAWTILSGFPDEKEEWYEETNRLLPLLFHLCPANGIISIRYDRFSPYHDRPDDWGLNLEPYDAYRHVYPDYRDQYSDIAYFFKKSGISDDESSPHIPKENKNMQECLGTIKRWRNYWNLKRANGLEQPQLTLNSDPVWNIYDDRAPNEMPTTTKVLEPMVKLLQYCRVQRRRTSVLNLAERNLKIFLKRNSINSLLEEAIQNGWIVETGGNLVSIVQNKNEQQINIRHWPGGMLEANTEPNKAKIAKM